MSPQTAVRTQLVAFLRREIVGPEAQDEVVDESPRKRYSAGILFPRIERDDEDASPQADDEAPPETEGEDPGAWQEAPADTDTDDDRPRKASAEGSAVPSDDNDEGVLLANTYFPAAMGLTFMVDHRSAPEVVVQVFAALYDPFDDTQPNGKPRRRWKRRVLAPDVQRFRLENTAARIEDREPVEGLGLRLVRRDRADGTSLVTVSLANRRPPRSGTRPPSARDCFFQVGFSIRSGDGRPAFLPTDVVAGRRGGSEEESLALLYRMRRQFAVGHGCAAEWGAVAEGRVADLSTETVPGVVVPPIEATGIGGKALDIHHLAGLDGGQEEDIPETLTALTSEYARWLEERESEAARLPAALTEAARRHLVACREALRRMEAGIALLRSNGLALRAFMLANRSILMQQHHSKLPNRELQDAWPEAPDNYRPSASGRGRWRSFQIGFLLMNIPAFMDGSDGFDDVRNVVDLIWFPTGGGKTEAYLGLTAYAIFLRRLLRPANGGCTVLMRYTLRLLTAQQFQRAASLICACELIRSQDEKRLGTERISLGLWVGGQASPNKREDAVKALGQLARPVTDDDRRRENPFQLLACPWCGT